MSIRTILVALAFDDDSRHVASRAVQLALQHKASIIGVHVIEDPVLQDPEMPSSINATALVHTIQEESRHELQLLLASQNEDVTLHVETGKANQIIESLAAIHKPDIIVIGPGAAKGLREKLFGSTADYVVRHASCPVLVVRGLARTPYRHITAGVDFSDHSKAAALRALSLSPSAASDFIHVFDIPLQFEQAMLKAGTSQAEIDIYRNAKINAARKSLNDIYDKNSQWPQQIRVKVIRGDPAIELIRISHSKITDLVALGTQGTGPIAQHLLGSVTRQVLNGAGCDVLVVSANVK